MHITILKVMLSGLLSVGSSAMLANQQTSHQPQAQAAAPAKPPAKPPMHK